MLLHILRINESPPRVIFCRRWSFIQSCSRHDDGSGTQVFGSEAKLNLLYIHCSDWLRGSHQMRDFLVILFFSLEANCQSLVAGLCNAMALWTGWCHLRTGHGGSEGNINLILCVAGIQLETEILNLIWGYKATRIRNNYFVWTKESVFLCSSTARSFSNCLRASKFIKTTILKLSQYMTWIFNNIIKQHLKEADVEVF